MKKVLSVAGSDCSGGAGIQADIKTICAHGMYAMSVITALTAQNTMGVSGILPTPADFVAKQMDCIFEDIIPQSIKVGMVFNREIADVTYQKLKDKPNVVIDPVMVSTSGSSLLDDEAAQVLIKKLFTIAKVVTPNIPEAELICRTKIAQKSDMEVAARKIYDMSGSAVLVKGGHSVSDAEDFLYAEGEGFWFSSKRIDNPNTHGTGCTLSAAIACNLAEGYSLIGSVSNAKDYLTGAIKAGLDIGKGQGPLNHVYKF